MHPQVRIQLLGQLAAELRWEACGPTCNTVRFRSQKAAELLACLATPPGKARSRSWLIELLWPAVERESGRNRLRIVLHTLRSQLEPPGVPEASILEADRFSVRLNPATVRTDVQEFEAALESARRSPHGEEALTRALALYQGPFLPGFDEEWILAEKERLAERYFDAALREGALLGGHGRHAEALQVLRRALGFDPLREEVHRAIIAACAATGEAAAARRQFAQLEQILAGAGLTPSAASQDLLAALPLPGAVAFRTVGDTGRASWPVSGRLSPAVATSAAAIGGAVPTSSPFYIARRADALFAAALARGTSIALVKGPRHVGKTSLLARGLQAARESGARVAWTDLERLTSAELASEESLYLALADDLHEQLALAASPTERWDPRRSWSVNFERYLRREALAAAGRLVWAVDGVDRLFGTDFGTELFAIFRSWHNERALEPASPVQRLTLAIAYSTEPHLFIADLNLSPFNVGDRFTLEDFTPEEVAELNRRYGSPLPGPSDLMRLRALVGGHPYLVQRALHELTTGGGDLAALTAQATRDGGCFADHLRRLLTSLTRDPALCDAVRQVLRAGTAPDLNSLCRLRSAGLVTGDTLQQARPRCELYRRWFTQHLA